jgi:4-hydroxybenzoyl-CoA thioesterase
MFATTRALHFGDCDPAGIAYYPSYLRILDSVLEEFFGTLGVARRHMIEVMRMGTPTLTLNLTFESPGYYGETMAFELRVLRIGRSSLDMSHTVSVGERVLWRAEQRIVATSLETHKSCAWPDEIRAALLSHLENTNA